jgi:glycosyltransferase involved in cell wall biosynthesis
MKSDKRLKILMMISGSIRGENGYDNVYLRLTRELRKAGHHICFYVYDAPPADILDKFTCEGASFVVRGLGRSLRLKSKLEVLLDCLELTIRARPNLLVGQYSTCGNAVAVIGKIFKIPSVKIVHAASTQMLVGGNGSSIRFSHRLKHRLILRMATRVVAVSNAVANDLIENYALPPNRLLILKNGIDPDDYKPSELSKALRDALAIPRNAPVILTVAALNPVKGHETLIKALSMPALSNVHLLLAGSGPLEKTCKALAARLDLTHRIYFLGQRKDIPDLLAASDISVLPSLSDAFPLYILESMSARLPVIASSVDGIPEIVENGKTGILVPPGDVEALENAISTLIDNPQRAKQMGRAGQKKLLEQFSLSARIAREIELYESLICE